MGAKCSCEQAVARDDEHNDSVGASTSAVGEESLKEPHVSIPSDEDFLKTAKSGTADQLSELIKQGANLAAKDANDCTALHLAAIAGNAAVVTMLINGGADIDALDSQGLSPLNAAAAAGKLDICSELLQGGANLEVKSEAAITPLQTALASKQSDVLKMLIEKNANVKADNGHGKSPLLLAIEAEMHEIATLIAEQGVSKGDADVLGQQLLTACSEGAWERATLLASWGADCNMCEEANAKTPLRLAAEKEEVGIIQVLLDKGANVESKAKDGKTTFMYSVDKGKSKLAALISSKGVSKEDQVSLNKKLVTTFTKGDAAKSKSLLVCKASPAAKHLDGRPLIQVAVESGKRELVELLVSSGVGKKTTAKGGGSLLKVAVNQSEPKLDIASCLKDSGFTMSPAELKEVEDKMCADARDGKTAKLQVAILLGANVNILVGDTTPVAAAVGGEELDTVKMLVDAKADINVRVGMYSVTPLYMAAARKKVEIAKFLISKGANKDGDDPEGQKEFDKLPKKK